MAYQAIVKTCIDTASIPAIRTYGALQASCALLQTHTLKVASEHIGLEFNLVIDILEGETYFFIWRRAMVE